MADDAACVRGGARGDDHRWLRLRRLLYCLQYSRNRVVLGTAVTATGPAAAAEEEEAGKTASTAAVASLAQRRVMGDNGTRRFNWTSSSSSSFLLISDR